MEYGLLEVSGPDAKKFLQGQLTCNVDKLNDDHYQLCAHCNPQGRILSLFYLINKNNRYYLLMPKSLLSIAENALKKYAVFFKVQMNMSHDTELNNLIQDCLQHRLKNHIPNIYPETSGKFLPHELNLPEFGAVDFDKGCYTGQEIIARMHYKGKIKNKLFHFQLSQDIDLAFGEDVYLESDQACGTIVDKINSEVLIILNESYINKSLFLKNKTPLLFNKRVSNE